MWAKDYISALDHVFSEHADADRGAKMSGYMKGHFEFFGVMAGPRRELARDARHALGKPEPGDVLSFAELAWSCPERELQYVAVDELSRIVRKLDASDLAAVRALIVSKSWWDTVDALASHAVGGLVRDHDELVATMDLWIQDDDMWVARSALLHQLRFGESTDEERLFGYCEIQASHPDFFIRKAIGWALRQHARHAPDSVRQFLDRVASDLSPLSIREASKHL
ncbi:MAG: DNA alkylation repair protein [Acidimicrobiales bacterium]